MKALSALSVAGLALVGSMSVATAQYYGDGYRDRGFDRGYDRDFDRRDRDFDRRDRDFDRRDRGYDRRGGVAFDEREYLRCNPDVRRAVQSGQMESAIVHYRRHGQREGRRLTC